MSLKKSNLYASRVYAEHPIATWAMDEEYFFSSLISENQKVLSTVEWNFVNATSASSSITIATKPIDEDPIAKIYLTSSSPTYLSMSLNDPIVYADSIDTEKNSICISAHINIPTALDGLGSKIALKVSSVQIGFTIDSETFYEEFTDFVENSWQHISFTKEITSENDVYPYIRVNYVNPQYGENDTSIYINGLSVGQWSENFNYLNTGVTSGSIPTNILDILDYPTLLNGFEIDQYGLSGSVAYLIQDGNKMLTKISSVPMVYGSKGNMSILPQSGSVSIPSLVFPGYGFLNKNGKYENLTAEFWLRLSNQSIDQVKIFGPISSNDGLYVGGEFLTLKVGKYLQSYAVGQWYRPMLVNISQSSNELFVMINGEKVISIPIESLEISTFPESTEDFLGFYGNENIPIFEIDCFSIFPYVVADQVAKRRYVYGQGVDEQENIVIPYGGELTYVDFPYAGYNSTIRYPDRTSWSDGYYNNLSVTSEGISFPSYNLPDVIFTSSDNLVYSESVQKQYLTSFEEDNFAVQDEAYPFFTMYPNSEYSQTNGTLYFAKINQTPYDTKSFHAILKSSASVSSEQSIAYFYNTQNTDFFEITLSSGSIQYIFNDEVIQSASVGTNEYFAVGVDFDKISSSYPESVNNFFSNPDNLSLNFAGRGGNKFLGKVFSVTLNSEFFTEKDGPVQSSENPNGIGIFDSDGFAFKNFSSDLYSYVGAYTLLPKQSNSTVFFDIGCSGYWEDSIPLAYFGKYITDSLGNIKYDLDILQFNIDIPTSSFAKTNTSSQSYQDSILTKIYVGLERKNTDNIKTYLDYSNTEVISLDRILDFNSVEDFESTKFEVCDGTIIYAPKDGIGFENYFLNTYIILTSRGINTEKSRIKNMSLASLTFDESTFYPISTPAQGKFYPITKIEDQYLYKKQIPVVIDNESSPYLYLTGDSGISILPQKEGRLVKGISIPVNEALKEDAEIVGIQMYAMFNESETFTERRLLGKFFSQERSYDIILIPESGGKRAFIKIYDSQTRGEVSDIRYFLNGLSVRELIISPLTWNHIVISLQDSKIELSGIIGELELYQGFKYDSVATFSDINSIKTNLLNFDQWNDADDFTWGVWASASWTEVLDPVEIQLTLLSVNGTDIFNTYAGLSTAHGDDDSILNVNFDSVQVLNDADWNTFEIKPV